MKRDIFQYVAGCDADGNEVKRWADPLQLQHDIWEACPELDKLYAKISPEEGQPKVPFEVYSPALKEMIRLVRQVFSMPPIDPGTGAGATIEHCRDALEAMFDFINQKKTPPGSSPTSLPPSAPSGPSP